MKTPKLTPQELATRVLNRITDPTITRPTFGQLVEHVGMAGDSDRGRPVDRALQTLRKKGQITFDRSTRCWRPVK